MTDTALRDVGVDTTRRRLRTRSERIRRRELDEALSRLDARGDLTDEQRAIVRQLSVRITDRIIAAPELYLAAATDRDRSVVRPVVNLFDLDGGGLHRAQR